MLSLVLSPSPWQISPGQKSSELWASLLAFFKFSLELGFLQPPFLRALEFRRPGWPELDQLLRA